MRNRNIDGVKRDISSRVMALDHNRIYTSLASPQPLRTETDASWACNLPVTLRTLLGLVTHDLDDRHNW